MTTKSGIRYMINDNFLCLQLFYLHAHVCTVYMLDACRSQKKALDVPGGGT